MTPLKWGCPRDRSKGLQGPGYFDDPPTERQSSSRNASRRPPGALPKDRFLRRALLDGQHSRFPCSFLGLTSKEYRPCRPAAEVSWTTPLEGVIVPSGLLSPCAANIVGSWESMFLIEVVGMVLYYK